MKFPQTLASGILIKRYKRFLANIQLPNGEEITIHCPNTGSMLNCNSPGARVWFSDANNPKRKYQHTWEIIESDQGHLIGINTHRANHLVKEAILNHKITELNGFTAVKTEVSLQNTNSRIDFAIELNDPQKTCYVEVKNVTLSMNNGIGFFPDTVSERATKHLHELIALKNQGHRAIILFCVQHTGIHEVSPADTIDSTYGLTLRLAIDQGVEAIAYQAHIDPNEIYLKQPLPVVCK